MTTHHFPGTHVTDDNRQAVLDDLGADHIATCPRCQAEYVWVRTKAETCWACWYSGFIGHYATVYQPVLDALTAAGIEASMWQTGGMCMAIGLPGPDGRGHFLIGDADAGPLDDDDLPTQYAIGYYPPDEEGAFDLVNAEGEPLFTDYGEIPGIDEAALPEGLTGDMLGIATVDAKPANVVALAQHALALIAARYASQEG